MEGNDLSLLKKRSGGDRYKKSVLYKIICFTILRPMGPMGALWAPPPKKNEKNERSI